MGISFNRFNGNFDDVLNCAREKYFKLEEENKRLRAELSSFDEKEEIKELQDEIDSLRRHSLLILSDEELARRSSFILKHAKKHQIATSKFQSESFTITHTGIGSEIIMQCPICGESEDITDCW